MCVCKCNTNCKREKKNQRKSVYSECNVVKCKATINYPYKLQYVGLTFG